MKEQQKNEFGNKKSIILVNSVTLLRFLASFTLIPIFKLMGGMSAAIFSTIFLFTDFIDGTLARKLKASTFFGALFDGLTDKLFSIIAFLLLMSINPIIFFIPLILEIYIILIQNKKLKCGTNIKSNLIGKIKTWILSMSMIGSFILVDTFNLSQVTNYLKAMSMTNIYNIKNYLAIFGIELPAIIFQLLTISSYKKELNNDISKTNSEAFSTKPKYNQTEDIECLEIKDKKIINDTNSNLTEISKQRENLLNIQEKLLQLKIMFEKSIDPEYYEKNKDIPVRKLIKE